MSFEDAIALQPQWVQLWLNVLFGGAFILPLALLIWRQTRLAAILTIASGIIAGFGTTWLYDQLGYVRLLGLPHIIFWTPLVIYLVMKMRQDGVPQPAVWVLRVITAVIVISLAFDYTDTARYLLGERAPF